MTSRSPLGSSGNPIAELAILIERFADRISAVPFRTPQAPEDHATGSTTAPTGSGPDGPEHSPNVLRSIFLAGREWGVALRSTMGPAAPTDPPGPAE